MLEAIDCTDWLLALIPKVAFSERLYLSVPSILCAVRSWRRRCCVVLGPCLLSATKSPCCQLRVLGDRSSEAYFLSLLRFLAVAYSHCKCSERRAFCMLLISSAVCSHWCTFRLLFWPANSSFSLLASRDDGLASKSMNPFCQGRSGQSIPSLARACTQKRNGLSPQVWSRMFPPFGFAADRYARPKSAVPPLEACSSYFCDHVIKCLRQFLEPFRRAGQSHGATSASQIGDQRKLTRSCKHGNEYRSDPPVNAPIQAGSGHHWNPVSAPGRGTGTRTCCEWANERVLPNAGTAQ